MRTMIEQSKKYLYAANESERMALRQKLESVNLADVNYEELAAGLKPSLPEKVTTGWQFSLGFQSPGLAGRYPEQPITVYVPPDYDPARAYGLAIMLHGGGRGSGDGGLHFYKCTGVNDLLEASGRIVCYPSAPPNMRSWARWHLPEAERYLMDVITELEHFYNIDPHNVILGGTSMGGMGANHMAHRLADRFASVFSSASHWDLAYWHCLTGMTMWISQGINDAVMFRRRHGTDIEFARAAKMRLDQAGVPCFYREHSGGHPMLDGRPAVYDWLKWSRDKRRDPFHPRVVAVTPRGLTPWSDWRRHKIPSVAVQNHTDFHDLADSPHARWVTIDAIGNETIMFDMMTMSNCRDAVEDDWNNITFTVRRKHLPGGVIDAFIRDDGVVEVTAKNVKKFTLWLHPQMFKNPDDVRIMVRGRERFRGRLDCNLATLLDSYLRRRDWGLLYPARVTIEDETGEWCTRDQLQVLSQV